MLVLVKRWWLLQLPPGLSTPDIRLGLWPQRELLADQHLKSFYDWFSPLGIDVQVLTGRLTQKVRKQVERGMKTGQTKIVIGTHALFQEGVEFKRLGLVIVDEQHRFGVGQRFALREKGVVNKQVPHQLVMTATPIPRTLAMGFYADLDVSNITELPPGRIPIKTEIISSDHRMKAIQRVDAVCASGQQAYWVCPLIDKSEYLTSNPQLRLKNLSSIVTGRRIALIHGRIKSDKRDKIMTKFRKGEIDVLVATTVIEVGVDVPNASLMVMKVLNGLDLPSCTNCGGGSVAVLHKRCVLCCTNNHFRKCREAGCRSCKKRRMDSRLRKKTLN